MRIALVNNYLPFVYGGAEFLVDSLKDELLARGHEVTLTRVPFPATLDYKLFNNILTCRCLRFDQAEKVIAFKFPAYYVKHPNKTLWLFHQLRQVYELWDGEYGLKSDPDTVRLKEVVTNSDNLFLREVKKIFVLSKEVAGRLKKYDGIDSEVLYMPLPDREKCHLRGYGDFLFYPSRVTSFKRQHLAIESMRYTRSKVRLVLAGKCDEPDYDARLRELVAKHGLDDKVVMLGWIDQEKKFDLMAESLACVYLAYQEDCHGLVPMEAFYSRKCVITLHDSGGTRELIEDGVNGLVVPPDPKALAEKFDALYEKKNLARQLGENGFAELTSRDIDWDAIIARLIA